MFLLHFAIPERTCAPFDVRHCRVHWKGKAPTLHVGWLYNAGHIQLQRKSQGCLAESHSSHYSSETLIWPEPCFFSPQTVQEIMSSQWLMLVLNFLSDILRLNIMLWFEIHAGNRSLVAIQSFCWLLRCKQALLPTVLPDELSPVFFWSVNCILVKLAKTCSLFLLSCVSAFQFRSFLLIKKSGPQIIALVSCSDGIVKSTIWLTGTKMNPTAQKWRLSTLLGSLLITAVLCLRDRISQSRKLIVVSPESNICVCVLLIPGYCCAEAGPVPLLSSHATCWQCNVLGQ